jgi:hypothetical protein
MRGKFPKKKEVIYWGPLKITKQTHFGVTENKLSHYVKFMFPEKFFGWISRLLGNDTCMLTEDSINL